MDHTQHLVEFSYALTFMTGLLDATQKGPIIGSLIGGAINGLR